MVNKVVTAKLGSSDQMYAISRAQPGTAHGFWHADSTAGCGAVTISTGMTLNVASVPAAAAIVNGTANTAYAGGTVTITTADPSNPRRDVVYIDSSGAVGVTAGTAATNPARPTLTAGRLALAEVAVSAGATAIAAGDVTDSRQQLAGARIVQKSADETVTSSALLQADDHLFFSIQPSERWYVRFHLNTSFPSTQGWVYSLDQPTSCSAYCYVEARVNAGTGYYATQGGITGPVVQGSAAGSLATPGFTVAAVTIDALIVNSTTAGTVTLYWGQQTSGAVNTTINGDSGDASFLTAYRLA